MLCELQNIVKTYPAPPGYPRLTVLNGVSLSLDKGESVSVAGPSGCGKSTLLHIAAGLDTPDSGSVLIDGNDISRLNESELAVTRNRKVGMVFQRHYLLPQCTLLENVLIPSLPHQNKQEKTLLLQRALNLLERLGLADRVDRFPRQLSGGERQRGALARAFINYPSLICADEPTGSLDRQSAADIVRLLREVSEEEQTALILVTDSESIAAEMKLTLELSGGALNAKGRRGL